MDQEDDKKKKTASFPVIEEEVRIDKKIVETGKIRLSKKVHEEEETFELPEMQEDIEVERVPVNKYIDSEPPSVRQEGNTVIYPVMKEVAVIEKRLVLVEEIRITRKEMKSTSRQRISLRKEEVEVKRESKKPGEQA